MGSRILIVDDAAFMRMMIKDILSKNGYDIVGEAENGKVALEKYQELRPELTTMDITMPEMDGISAVKEIRKVDPKANIIMCSAMGQQAMVIDAIQAGAQDFIVKPFQPDRVLEAVRKALSQPSGGDERGQFINEKVYQAFIRVGSWGKYIFYTSGLSCDGGF